VITTDLLHSIFSRTSEGILIAEHGAVAQANPAALAMLGITHAELIGKPLQKAFASNPPLAGLFDKPSETTIEIRLARKRLALGTVVALSPLQTLVLLRDVTEQRDLDSRREALVNSIAHDLRNPISALYGYADLVGKMGDLNEDQQLFLTRVRQTTQKLHDVLSSLVDLAWIEAGMPLHHQPVDLIAVIDDVLMQHSELAHSKSIAFARSIQEPLAPIMGDPLRLHMALSALIDNAIRYSDAEKLIVVHAWGDANETFCSIADQGYGIDAEEVDMVFDRMYRSRDERIREMPGGGVGLTLAKKIIMRHGGEISVTSTLARGSTFTFRLPAASRLT
jgi:signal transduction histidine kinase